MKTTAIALSRFRQTSRSNLAARLPGFIALTKPRVMALAVFTAVVGLMLAPSRLDPLLGSVAIAAIAAGAGAAGVLNMWYDADIDAVMTRTAGRPIPRGTISRMQALAFGLVLACSAVGRHEGSRLYQPLSDTPDVERFGERAPCCLGHAFPAVLVVHDRTDGAHHGGRITSADR